MNSIVIGSGFGGIATALRLKAKGHQVTIIEKHPDLGGRARVFRKDGFVFDGGPTVITAPYLINELFELFQKDPKDYIQLSPLKIWYQFIFEDKTKFNYSGDETEMKKQIEKLSKKDVRGYENICKTIRKEIPQGQVVLSLMNGDSMIHLIHDEKAGRLFLGFLPDIAIAELKVNDSSMSVTKLERVSIHVDSPRVADEDEPNFKLGIWIPFNRVDHLSFSGILDTGNFSSLFSIEHDPDHGWKGNIMKPITNHPIKKADAYHFSHRSLLKDIYDVLEKKETCLVKLPKNSFVTVSKFKKVEKELSPMQIQITDKVFIFISDEHDKIVSKEETKDYLQRFEGVAGAAKAAGFNPELSIYTSDLTKDEQLISVLEATRLAGIDKIMLHHTEAKGVKKVLEQNR